MHYATMEWRDGMPYSKLFDDVYFSSDNGLEETEYVFIQGNNLHEKWRQLRSSEFTIIETGFGTGLNFLCAAKLWLQTAPPNATLNFISVEKYPLTLHDIKISLTLWPSLNTVVLPFLAQYEQLLKSGSVMLYDNRINLNLLFGDAKERLETLPKYADAWFLDGFSPAKNPEMWQPDLFKTMAQLSHIGTSFATFTSAGDVRRELKAAGFQVKKRTGYGKKREMLHGNYSQVDHDG